MVKKLMDIIVTPYGLLTLAAIVLIIGKIVFKKSYLNCFNIIKKHLECFKNGNKKYSIMSMTLYFGVPYLLSLSLVQIRELDEDVVDIVTIIISILTSMLFTMLTFILDMRKNIRKDEKYDANTANVSVKVLEETYYTIMFEVLVCVVILIMCFIIMFSKIFRL